MSRLVCFFASLLLCTGCKHSRPQITASSPAGEKSPQSFSAGEARIVACSLVTTEEVGEIQRTTISDAKSTTQSSGNLVMSQCYYAATGPNLSVSLAVTQPDPRNPTTRSTRDQWEQTFGRFDTEKGEAKEEEEKKGPGPKEEEERATPPKKIEGIGEEAFWAGNRVGGALYVLKGDVFIRISVGGPGDEQSKLEKSKQLAQKALSRLP